jgi:cytochrome P450
MAINSSELFENISRLTTTHWHGIVSVPLNVKMPMILSSGYRKAQEAKEKLLDIVEEKIKKGNVRFVNQLVEAQFSDDHVKNHILIFMCALIPKASASLLTNFFESSHLWYDKYVSEDGDIDEDILDTLLMETLRLWPPFIGGLRCATQDFELGPYHVPKGYAVFYNAAMAHRDPDVFPKAEEFVPERWTTFNKNDRDKLFGFGAGVHRCVGEKLIWKFFLRVATRFVKRYRWDPAIFASREKKLKYVPISRPLEQVPFQLTLRSD